MLRIGGFSFSSVPRPGAPFNLLRRPLRPFFDGGGIALTWGASGQGCDSFVHSKPRLIVSLSESRALLHDAARFRARSTSHTVAAQDGNTNIPLAAAGAQVGETILVIGISGHGLSRFVHPDPPELIRSWKI
jgi:hypothetical protein